MTTPKKQTAPEPLFWKGLAVAIAIEAPVVIGLLWWLG